MAIDQKVKITLKILILFCLSIAGTASYAQKVRLEQADMISGGRKGGERFDRFIGNVIFIQKDIRIYCDTAVFFRRANTLEAVGSVRITEGDSVNITARKLDYDGNTRTAYLRNNVVFTKRGVMTLYTDLLDYNRDTQVAKYYEGGRLVDSTNTLNSEKGYYNNATNMASFKKDVVGVNPDYTLKSDTLQYNTISKVIYFHDYTELEDEEGNILTYYEGRYDTRSKRSALEANQIDTESYILKARRFDLDDVRRYYLAKQDVELIAKEDNVIIYGNIGEHYKDAGITKIYDDALMKFIVEEDTLFMRADTLVSIDSEIEEEKRILAYPNVRMYKSNLQGKSDSLAYFMKDSLINFYFDPILWTGDNQITADTLQVEIRNKKIDKLHMLLNSFVISADSLANYNQVKGRRMTAYFEENVIDKVDVNGNGESIFFALDETDTEVMGLNKIICSDLIIHFEQNTVDNISALVKPEARFVPPHEWKKSEMDLKGFDWRIKERPTREDVLGTSTPVKTLPKEKLRNKIDAQVDKN